MHGLFFFIASGFNDPGTLAIGSKAPDFNLPCIDGQNYTLKSFEDIKVRAREKHFNFPYLYDGETEIASRQYGPVSTPHIFIFDKDRILRYSGRIDDMENPHKTPHSSDTRNAIDALLNHKEVPVAVTKVFGCSIKWIEKNDWMDKAAVQWAKEPVTLDTISVAGVADLVKNNSDKLILINVWATWCG